jgi:small subunit ribosomal protein S6
LSNRLYEGMFLLDSNLVSKDWAGLEKHVQDILKRHGAETVYSEKWPDRRLAYDVKGCKKGTYYLAYFNAPSTAIPEIHRDIELSERILRAMFIQENGVDTEMERRKNKEIDPPPADLTFGEAQRSFGSRGRFRRRDEREPGAGGARPGAAAASAPESPAEGGAAPKAAAAVSEEKPVAE